MSSPSTGASTNAVTMTHNGCTTETMMEMRLCPRTWYRTMMA